MTESNPSWYESGPELFSTLHYAVKVSSSPFGKESDGKQYIIINKETGVCEAENRVLAYAKAWALQFEELLETFEERQKLEAKGVEINHPAFDGIPSPPPEPLRP